MNWSADSQRLLLSCGPDVLEYPRPSESEYTDPTVAATRETYEIHLPVRRFRLLVRDNRPIDTQEEDDLAEVQAEKLLAEGAVLGGPELDEQGNLRVREPTKPKPVLGLDLLYDVSACVYSPLTPDTFFVTLDGGGNREDPNYFPGQQVETLYECRFAPDSGTNIAPPVPAPAAPAVPASTGASAAPPQLQPQPGLHGESLRSVYLGRHLGTVHSMRLSLSKQYLLLGTRNGGAQMRSVKDLAYFFYTHYHDGTGALVAGAAAAAASTGGSSASSAATAASRSSVADRIGVVSGVALTFDDRFLLSVGHDGNFFAHLVDPAQALQAADRSVEEAIASERRAAEEARLAKIKAKEEAAELARKEEEERVAREAAAAARKDAKTREQKEREAREAKEKEIRDKEAKERHVRERDARLKLREERKNDKEREDENFDHLSVRIPGKLAAQVAPPPQDASAQELLEDRLKPSAAAAAAAIPAADADAPDIVDPKSYSIEEAKLKQEEDDRVAAAESKKAAMRAEVAELRQEFLQLLRANETLDPSQRLPRDAFELDPQLRAELEAEAQSKIEEVRAELAWISEKHSLALQKLRSKFLDGLVVEHMTLRAFHSGMSVSSFRTPELPPFLRSAIEHVHRMMESEENMRTQQEQQMQLAAHHAGAAAAAATGGALTTGTGMGGESFESKDNAVARGSGLRGALNARAMGSTTGGARNRPPGMSEAQMRKQARAERAVQLARLKASKPDKHTDDPADVAAVQYAEKHMGDYKLKSDPAYIVPEHQRVNADRKRRQMVLLHESVHYIKMALNERFLALRDLKARIIKSIQKDNVRLRELNATLGIEEELFEPQLDASEWPEHRELFTKEDLKRFETEREKERVRAVNLGSRSMFASGDEDEEGGSKAVTSREEKKEAAPSSGGAKGSQDVAAAVAAAASSSVSDGSVAAAASSAATAAAAASSSSSHSADPDSLAAAAVERRTLLEKMSFALASFDTSLSKLRREKFKLDADLKSTDLKVLTLYQELQLLKAFEENETRLFSKLAKARQAKSAVVGEMTECERALSHKLSEIKSWQEKDKAVLADFQMVVGGEKSEFYSQLLRIFKKKVKRSKKKAGAGGGAAARAAGGAAGDDDEDDDSDDGGGSDSNSSGSDNSDSDSDSDSSAHEDACPLHLDSAIYEKVLELREKRLEQEEMLVDFNRSVTELNKSYERLGGKERTIDKELSGTEADIEAFQSEKQRALNLIEVAIPLKLHQMKFLTPAGRLPRDISKALIFTAGGMGKLQRRIGELANEKATLQRQFKELKKQHKTLIKELANKREEIAKEKAKCEEVQMLKFGEIIDLHILEKVGVDDGASELEAKLSTLEAGGVARVEEWDHRIDAARDELARITEQNTRWLDKVAKLTKAQYDLEDTLNHTRNVHVADSAPMDEQANVERSQLLELVQLQEREVDALKAEIHILRRKGGQVYTPQA